MPPGDFFRLQPNSFRHSFRCSNRRARQKDRSQFAPAQTTQRHGPEACFATRARVQEPALSEAEGGRMRRNKKPRALTPEECRSFPVAFFSSFPARHFRLATHLDRRKLQHPLFIAPTQVKSTDNVLFCTCIHRLKRPTLHPVGKPVGSWKCSSRPAGRCRIELKRGPEAGNGGRASDQIKSASRAG